MAFSPIPLAAHSIPNRQRLAVLAISMVFILDETDCAEVLFLWANRIIYTEPNGRHV
jgi:hypothetical protein